MCCHMQLLSRMEDSGPPPASDERIAALPLVDVSDELIGEWIWHTESHSCLWNFEYMCCMLVKYNFYVPQRTKLCDEPWFRLDCSRVVYSERRAVRGVLRGVSGGQQGMRVAVQTHLPSGLHFALAQIG